MEEIYSNILYVIISCVVTYSLIVPTSHIFGLEDSNPVNGSINPSETSQSARLLQNKHLRMYHRTSKQQKVSLRKPTIRLANRNHPSSQNKQLKLLPGTDRTPHFKQSEQTTKVSSSTDRTPPGRVGTVTVRVISNNQIDLKWTGIKEPDFNHYNVYMDTKPSFKVSPGVTAPRGTSNTNSYSSTGLNPSTRYYYKITAVDDANNIGPLSNTKSGMTKGAVTSTQLDSRTQESTGLSSSSTLATSSADTSPPAQVTGLIIRTLSSTQLYLTWSRVTASDFNHYNIYRGNSGFTVTPGVTVPTGTSTTSSYSNTGLNPSTTYSYRITAVDNAGNIGTPSSQVSKTTAGSTSDKTPPAQVTGLIVSTVSSSQLNLAWTQVSASDFNHYNIYRGTSPNFAVTLGITLPLGTSTANSYSSTGLEPFHHILLQGSSLWIMRVILVLYQLRNQTSTAGTTSGTGNVYDDFQGGTYKLTDGQKSPNGKWLSKWNAGGEMGVKSENSNNVFYGFPKTATSPGQTFSSFALSTHMFSDMTLELDMKTYKQLRQNSAPNSWESAWVIWRWTRSIPPLLLCTQDKWY